MQHRYSMNCVFESRLSSIDVRVTFSVRDDKRITYIYQRLKAIKPTVETDVYCILTGDTEAYFLATDSYISKLYGQLDTYLSLGIRTIVLVGDTFKDIKNVRTVEYNFCPDIR